MYLLTYALNRKGGSPTATRNGIVALKCTRLIPIITKAFGDDDEVQFGVLVSRLGRSRKTSFYWLKRVEEAGLVRGFFMPAGRGRPILVYRLNRGFSPSNPGEVVSIPFRKLQGICSYREGGSCRLLRILQPCTRNRCVLVAQAMVGAG